MDRTTKKKLRSVVAMLQDTYKCDIDIEFVNGRPRITNRKQSRDISPRLTVSEMNVWLDGFRNALFEQWRKD